MNVCGGGSGPSAFFGDGESAPLLSPFLCDRGGDARLLTSDLTLPGILLVLRLWRPETVLSLLRRVRTTRRASNADLQGCLGAYCRVIDQAKAAKTGLVTYMPLAIHVAL